MLAFLFAALVMIIAIFVAIAIILGGIGVLITMLYIEIIKPVFTFPKKVAHFFWKDYNKRVGQAIHLHLEIQSYHC